MNPLLPSVFTEELSQLRRQFDDLTRNFGRAWPTFAEVGAGVPAVNVAESEGAIEIAAELPGVEEQDVKVELDHERVIISGEKKREREEQEKDWRLVERSYGSFRRMLSLPFEPAQDAVSAYFDKGVLKINVAKPKGAAPSAKTIEIKKGAPPAKAA
jgi:HSP20 family protein